MPTPPHNPAPLSAERLDELERLHTTASLMSYSIAAERLRFQQAALESWPALIAEVKASRGQRPMGVIRYGTPCVVCGARLSRVHVEKHGDRCKGCPKTHPRSEVLV